MQAFATLSTDFFSCFVPGSSFVNAILPNAEAHLTWLGFHVIARLALSLLRLNVHHGAFRFGSHHGSICNDGAWQWLLSHHRWHGLCSFCHNIFCNDHGFRCIMLAAFAANIAGIHDSNAAKFIDAPHPNFFGWSAAFFFANATWIVVYEATCIPCLLRLLLCCILQRFVHACIV